MIVQDHKTMHFVALVKPRIKDKSDKVTVSKIVN